MKSSGIIKLLKKDGWFIHNIRGSHHQFKHTKKDGKVTVPHPKSDLPKGTVNSILKQAQIIRKNIIPCLLQRTNMSWSPKDRNRPIKHVTLSHKMSE